jgi:hypothetical protein
MTPPGSPSYAGYRFPPEIISYAVWLYFHFPLSLRMVEEMLAFRGIAVSYETVRQWGRKFGQAFANRIRDRLPCGGDKWHLHEVVILSVNPRLILPDLATSGDDTRSLTALCGVIRASKDGVFPAVALEAEMKARGKGLEFSERRWSSSWPPPTLTTAPSSCSPSSTRLWT